MHNYRHNWQAGTQSVPIGVPTPKRGNDKSYGLQVASLASVPRSVIEKAKTKLRHLEDKSYSEQQAESGTNQLDLFANKGSHPAISLLEDVNPDDLSPKQALELVYKLRGLV